MRQYQLPAKSLISACLAVAVVVVLVLDWWHGNDEWRKSWGAVGLVASITFGLWQAVRYFLWRMPPVCWWLKVPDIGGTWTGVLQTDYAPMVGQDIPVTLTINQTLTSLRVALQTATSKSNSFAAALCEEPDAHRWQLIYTYLNVPSQAGTTLDMHYGTAIFEIIMVPQPRLSGIYMTKRASKTSGTIEVTRP